MTFGRPTLIARKWKVPVPILIDDEYLRSDGVEGAQPPDTPSKMGLFVYSCALFELLAEILESFYVDDCEATSTNPSIPAIPDENMIASALDFNRRLDKFADSIPIYLRTCETSQIVVSDRDNHVNLQQQVLYCRYICPLNACEYIGVVLISSRFLYIRVLSLRPVLLLATKYTLRPTFRVRESSLDRQLIEQCCNLCVLTAHRLVEAIHQHLGTAYRSTGWHSVYCTVSFVYSGLG